MVRPSRRTFRALSRSGLWVPVAASFPQEASPQSIFEALRLEAPNVLLESARLHPVTGRYSIIVGEPRLVLAATGQRVSLYRRGGARRFRADPFEVLQQLLQERPSPRLRGLPPFVGGAVGFVGYDTCRILEKLPARARNDFPMPDLGFLFCDEAVVIDHLLARVWVTALAAPGGDPDRSYDEATSRVERLSARVQQRPPEHGFLPAAAPSIGGQFDPRKGEATHDAESFGRMVREAKRFIADGDIYQANLSQRFLLPVQEDPWLSYRRLCAVNPSPFACYGNFSTPGGGGFQVVSSSPERLFRVSGGWIETRPIAGTRPRGGSAVETARLRRELILNEKERAEHLMLVDLERNDLGRVSRYGTVRVDDLMALEEYSHVMHIVSNMRGELRPRSGVSDIFRAAFPGGTISGCPKVRAMEVIEELEPVRRQLYTGSLGYLSATGEMDFNILIRTGFVRDGWAALQAGAGIVADSDPAREYEETLHKVEALRQVFAAQEAPAAAAVRLR